MTPERWRRIEDVFDRAIELPATERTDYVADACTGDTELEREVHSLLASSEGPDPVAAAIASSACELAVREARPDGMRVGPYRLVEKIGRGGMGTVYRAERDDGHYTSIVAVKLLDRDTPGVIARFRDERQILASLDHPAIVRLLDGGTDDGLPYLVMEYVRGEPIDAHARGLPIRERAALIARVAAALQYAHGKLVVHRDVKPGNILIDAGGAPKLLDFGIAKLLDGAAPREASTRTGVALLTPEYASPEQARGEPVSVATDVYSLGAVLYAVLGGRPPHDASGDALSVMKQICEVDPPRPSTIAPAADRAAIAGDLDSIAMRALQKRPERRYPSAAALGEDLERYLGGRPVLARDAALGYRMRKFVGRHRVGLAIASAVAAALVATTAIAVVQARRADEQAARVELANRNLIAERGVEELLAGQPERALPYLVEALRAGDESTPNRFAIAEAAREVSRELARLDVATGVLAIAQTADGARIAVCGMGGVLRLFDRHGAHVRDLVAPTSELYMPAFDARGTRFAAAGFEGDIYLWDLPSGRMRTLTAHAPYPATDAITAVVFAGDRLVTSGLDGRVVVWDPEAGRAVHTFATGAQVGSVASDGARIAAGLVTGDVAVWDAATGERVATLAGHSEVVTALRFTRDGARLVSGSYDGRARVWDVATGHAITTVEHGARIVDVRLAPDERTAVSAAGDAARVWEVATGRVTRSLAHTRIAAARFDGAGARIATVGDSTYRVWDVASGGADLTLRAAPGGGTAPHGVTGAIDAQFSVDGARLVTAAGSGARLWRLDGGPLAAAFVTRPAPGAAGNLHAAALSPDERTLAVVGLGVGELRDVTTGARLAGLAQVDPHAWDVAFSPDGTLLATAGKDRMVRVHAAATGEVVRAIAGHTGTVNRVAFSPDGARLVSAGDDHSARLWGAATGEPVGVLVHPDRVMGAAWSPDGTRIATAGWDRRLRVWDAATQAVVVELDGGTISFLDVTWSRDGRTLASAGHGGEAAVWDLATGARTLAIAAHGTPVTTASLSADGQLLVTTADDPILRIWDTRTGALLATRRHGGSVMQSVWDRSGMRIVTACTDGTVRIWDVRADTRSAAELDALLARLPYHLVDGRLVLTAGTR